MRAGTAICADACRHPKSLRGGGVNECCDDQLETRAAPFSHSDFGTCFGNSLWFSCPSPWLVLAKAVRLHGRPVGTLPDGPIPVWLFWPSAAMTFRRGVCPGGIPDRDRFLERAAWWLVPFSVIQPLCD